MSGESSHGAGRIRLTGVNVETVMDDVQTCKSSLSSASSESICFPLLSFIYLLYLRARACTERLAPRLQVRTQSFFALVNIVGFPMNLELNTIDTLMAS